MPEQTKIFLQQNEDLYRNRRNEILNSCDKLSFAGDVYYVSSAGSDENDGKSPEAPWKSLEKVSAAKLKPKDAVLFRRGDLFRGTVEAKSGVTYGAYGKGSKPTFYGGEKNYADSELWECVYPEKSIWKCREKCLTPAQLFLTEESFIPESLFQAS